MSLQCAWDLAAMPWNRHTQERKHTRAHTCTHVHALTHTWIHTDIHESTQEGNCIWHCPVGTHFIEPSHDMALTCCNHAKMQELGPDVLSWILNPCLQCIECTHRLQLFCSFPSYRKHGRDAMVTSGRAGLHTAPPSSADWCRWVRPPKLHER